MTFIMSFMKQSARPCALVGIEVDRTLAALSGMDGSLYFAFGGDGCIRPRVSLGSQSSQSGITSFCLSHHPR